MEVFSYQEIHNDVTEIIGDIIGKICIQENEYTDVKVLGKGTFGIVYLVKDSYGNFFARKRATSYYENTYYEAKMMEMLKGHENIVSIIESIPYQSGVDIIIELCEGTLLDLIYEYGGLELSVVKDVAFDIGKAIEYMRSKNMSHCDLKPENILYKKDASKKSGFRFLVADFGNVERGDFISSKIQTRQYRCFENLFSCIYKNNSVNQITSCDYFSLGCILFEAITGNYLYDSNDETSKLNDQLCFSFLDVNEIEETILLSKTDEKDPMFVSHLKTFFENSYSCYYEDAIDSVDMLKESFDIGLGSTSIHSIRFIKQLFPIWLDFIRQLVFPFPHLRLQGDAFFKHDVFIYGTNM